jgi:RNA polymerase sigma-70 factor, ECF subfamily
MRLNTGRYKAKVHFPMDGACLEVAGKIPAQGSRLLEADERELIERAQRGDRSAFDALVRLYDHEVLRLALRVVHSPEEARDLYQEAFLKVYRSLGHFRFDCRFSTWLYRVVMNACLDHLRRQKSRHEVQAPETAEADVEYFHNLPDERLNPERALEAREIQRRIDLALQGLNPRERMVFELKHYEGLRLRAIGELCGTTEETAKNCLFRATQKLREALSDLT